MIRQRVDAIVALGSNLGEREASLTAAVEQLRAVPGIESVELSPLRETLALTPTGVDPDAPRYLNAVARVRTGLDPHELLDELQRIETGLGRTRDVRWGDRTLDLDLIVFGGRVVQDDRLTVPHPRAFERDFVLAPWLGLDPQAVLMGHGRVAELLARTGDTTLPFPATDPAEGGQ